MLAKLDVGSAIEKAIERCRNLGENLDALKHEVRGSLPETLNSEQEKRQRRAFLETLYRERAEGDRVFERIIQGNELQDASFLERGALAARAVMRIVLKNPGGGVRGYGTGFLVGDGVLITNNHVLPYKDLAERAEAEAFYERDIYGNEHAPWRFALDTSLFYTSIDLDFTLVGIAPRDLPGNHTLSDLGWLPLIGGAGKAVEGEWLTIIQHPSGQLKQLCVRENQLLRRDADVLWYSTDTLAGSSGSPVFNNDWLLVALHHSGVPETVDGKWQTNAGRAYDPVRDGEDDIKWIANEGIRISRIVETLLTDPAAADPRIAAVISTNVGDLRARLPVLYAPGVVPPTAAVLPAGTAQKSDITEGKKAMADRIVTVRLAIGEDGRVRVVDQDEAIEAFAFEAKKKKATIDAPVEESEDWKGGFDPKFLDVDGVQSDLWLQLPQLSEENEKRIAPLRRDKPVYGLPVPTEDAAKAGILDYGNYSVVMNAKRRLAFFSAANIDGGVQFEISRPSDKWLWDDRISRAHQLGNGFYVNNKFDRGHLTRREDLEWGTNPVTATRRANGTCTWTNCSPQHETFNQDKDYPGKKAALWAGLEKYILEQTARHYQFRVQTITGPIFDDDEDPEYRGTQVPLRFWKIVAAVDASGKLFATGYILSQQFLVERDWDNLDEAAIEKPFGAFETYQVKIAEIEKETGLTFNYGDSTAAKRLTTIDAYAKELAKPAWRRRRRSGQTGTFEASLVEGGSFDGVLNTFEDIVLP